MSDQDESVAERPVTDEEMATMLRAVWPEVFAHGGIARCSIEVSAAENAKVVVERFLTLAELKTVRKYIERWNVTCVDRTRALARPEGGFQADSNEIAVPAKSGAPDQATSNSRPLAQ